MSVGILPRGPRRIIRGYGGNLFRIALDYLGDAEQWERIANINTDATGRPLIDPWLSGYWELQLPEPLPNAGGGAVS